MTTFLTGKALPRRTLLKGLGASLALPILDAMFPASRLAALTAPKRTHRFQAFYVPNGMAMEYWTPTGDGREFELSPILKPLAPFKDQMLALSGIHAEWVQIHAGASGSWLTGISQGGRTETEIFADVSMDQLLARELAKETQVASLELSMDEPANAGACSSNLSCVYTHTLSWRGPHQPLPTEYNPRAVFERLFGDAGSTDRAAREQRLRQQRSILDSVNSKLGDLRREIGAQDRVKVEQYTEAVRDVERRIERAESQLDLDLPIMEQPQGIPEGLEDHMELILDLQMLAFQSDLTRVSTFMVGRELNGRPYPQIGVPEAWHPLSHHRNIPELVARLAKINRYQVELFTRYLTKLEETPDGDGSLLDHMTILYGSGMSNSQRHAGENLPLLVVGGGNGRLKGGQHLQFDDAPSHANLLHTLLDKFDVPVDQVGSSTGRLPIDTISEM